MILVGILDWHSMRCLVLEVSSSEKHHHSVGSHLRSTLSGLWSASCRFCLWKEGTSWEWAVQAEQEVYPWLFLKGKLGCFKSSLHMCAHVENRDPRQCRSCCLGSPGVVGEGQEKMVQPARMSKHYSPSWLPYQDGADYTWQLYVNRSFFCHFKLIIDFFNGVSEQRHEFFLLSVKACWCIVSRAANTLLPWMM